MFSVDKPRLGYRLVYFLPLKLNWWNRQGREGTRFASYVLAPALAELTYAKLGNVCSCEFSTFYNSMNYHLVRVRRAWHRIFAQQECI